MRSLRQSCFLGDGCRAIARHSRRRRRSPLGKFRSRFGQRSRHSWAIRTILSDGAVRRARERKPKLDCAQRTIRAGQCQICPRVALAERPI